MRSMTGYGRVEKILDGTKLIMEIHSVNRKNLDMQIYLPKNFLRFDIDLRKWVGQEIIRGTLIIRLHLEGDVPSRLPSKEQLSQMRALKKNWEKIAKEIGYPSEVVNFPFIFDQMQNLSFLEEKPFDEGEWKKKLKQMTEQTLEKLVKMKEVEGTALARDMQTRMRQVQKKIEEIEKIAPKSLEEFKKKFKERLSEIVASELQEKSKFYYELEAFADKIDITEEIIRFKSHLDQFYPLLKSKEKSVGRNLDFLLQEMGREIATILAKNADLPIANLALEIKIELEKVREQIQNIE
ncbi:MAG: YicC family protein [Chlamydiae bacterium]|nr:YicC family protein [Chlamydiota bacterium]